MAISSQAIRLPILISMKNVFFCTNNCNKRYIMTTCTKLEKVLERLEKNPFFEKYANKIAKFQQTSPDEFLQRVENEEKKIQGRKGIITYIIFCTYLIFVIINLSNENRYTFFNYIYMLFVYYYLNIENIKI